EAGDRAESWPRITRACRERIEIRRALGAVGPDRRALGGSHGRTRRRGGTCLGGKRRPDRRCTRAAGLRQHADPAKPFALARIRSRPEIRTRRRELQDRDPAAAPVLHLPRTGGWPVLAEPRGPSRVIGSSRSVRRTPCFTAIP